MGRYVTRRLASLVPVLWVMATLVWVLMFLLPGDPARLLAGKTVDEMTLEAIRQDLGLDRSYAAQYAGYLGRLARLDLGTSYYQNRPVQEIVLQGAWPSAVLGLTAFALALLIGIAGGTLASLRPQRAADHAILLGSLLGIAVPVFWLGIMLRMVFTSWLGWLPVSRYTAGDAPPAQLLGFDALPMPDPSHLVLPALTLSAFSAGYFIRVMRASLLDVLGEDFIRTARAKGLSRERVLIRHALSQALVPLTTVAGVQLATLIGGAIATEIIFDWPGLGTVLLHAIRARDMPVVSGCVVFLTLVFVVVNLLVDLGYAWLDPRVRAT